MLKEGMNKKLVENLDDLEADLLAQLENVRALRASLLGEKSSKTPKSERRTTIKQDILEVLAEFPDGMTALEILEEIKTRYRPSLLRETLSPQLSRLKNNDKKIVVEQKIWRLSE